MPEPAKKHIEHPPKVKMKTIIFHNLQDKDAKGNAIPIEFTFEGKYYSLYNGKTYTLPEDLVEHLRSRKYPIFETRQDPENPDNQMCVKVGDEARFALYPVEAPATE